MNTFQIIELLKQRDSFKHFCKVNFNFAPTEIIEGSIATNPTRDTLAYFLWKSIFQSYQSFVVLSQTLAISKHLKGELQEMIDMLDNDLAQGLIVRSTADRVEFASGCFIVFRQANRNSVRGMTITGLLLNCTATNELLEEVLPALFSTGGQAIKSAEFN